MLRHGIAPCTLNCVDRTSEPRQPVTKYGAAEVVEFARDGDLTETIARIRDCKRVQVRSAMGAGKSSRVPLVLAERLGKVVIHTIPYGNAAHAMADYVKSINSTADITYIDDVSVPMPKRGVVLTTNAYVLARLFHDNFAGCDPFILYLDESHESDAYTAVLRDVAPDLGVVDKVVFATATHGVTPAAPSRLPGNITVNKYDAGSTKTWSANDANKPWTLSKLDKHLVFFLERETTIDRLAGQYRTNGCTVRMINRETTYSDYCETMRLLGSNSEGIAVVFVSYVVRSSVTIPGNCIVVESGEVAVSMVRNGSWMVGFRNAYRFEVDQGTRRFGRIGGSTVEIYVPNMSFINNICDLEPVEINAAALLYRMVGKRPPLNMMDQKMATGDVPIDIIEALNGAYPLQLYGAESLTPWINGHAPVRCASAVRAVVPRMIGRAVSCHTVPGTPANTRFPMRTVTEEPMPVRPVSPIDPVLIPGRSNTTWSVLNGSRPIYEAPKRLAKRLSQSSVGSTDGVSRPTSPVQTIASDELEEAPVVPPKDVVAKRVAVGDVTTDIDIPKGVQRALPQHLQSAVGQLNDVHRRADNATKDVVDVKLLRHGKYYYHSDMANAPEWSSYFPLGFQTIMQYATMPDAHVRVSVMPTADRSYAVARLIDKHNDQMAVVMGIQRLLTEISKRDDKEMQGIKNVQKLRDKLHWIQETLLAANDEVNLCRMALPLFTSNAAFEIPIADALEEKVMQSVMDNFNEAMQLYDNTNVSEYVKSFASRNVRVGVIEGRKSSRMIALN